MAGYADELSVKLSAQDEMSARLKGVRKELKDTEKAMAAARRELDNTGAPEAAAELRRLETQYDQLADSQRQLAKSSSQVKRDLDQIRAKAGQSATVASRLGSAWTKTASIFQNKVVAGISAVGVALAGRQAIRQFAEAEKMQASLQFAYSKFPQIADVAIGKFEELNTALMNATGADDDALAAAEANLAMYKLTGTQITALIPLVNDYAIRTGSDVVESAGVVGKALMGNARALKSLGIDFKATGDRSKDLASLMDALREKVGGAGDAFGDTGGGQLAVAEQNFGNLQETLGGTLVPALQAVVTVAKPVSETFAAMPEPVRATGVGVVALGTAALIATPRIVAMNTALSSQGGILGVGKRARGAAAGVAAVTTAVVALNAAMKKDDSGNVLTTESAYAADEYGRALRDIVQPGWGQSLANVLAGITDAVVPHNTALDDATTVMTGLDRKLVDLVTAGKGDEAKRLFDDLASGASSWGATVSEVKDLLPGYAAALGSTADAAGDLANEQGRAAGSANRLNRALSRLDKTIARREAVRAYRKALADFVAKPSVEAGDALASAMSGAAKTFRDPERRAKFVKTAVGDIRDAVNDSSLSSGIKSQIKSPLQESLVEARNLLSTLRSIALVKASGVGNKLNAMGFATGGLVTGPGTGTSDSIPARLSRGEFVIRERAVSALGVDTLNRLNQADRVPVLPSIVNAPSITLPASTVGRDAPLVGHMEVHATSQVDVELALLRTHRQAERDRRTRTAGTR